MLRLRKPKLEQRAVEKLRKMAAESEMDEPLCGTAMPGEALD